MNNKNYDTLDHGLLDKWMKKKKKRERQCKINTSSLPENTIKL